MGAWGEGPFSSDSALDWLAGAITQPIAGVIKRELEGFLDRKITKRRMMIWEPPPPGTKPRTVRGRKLRGGRTRIEYMMGRGRGHEAAEAAVGLLDELTPYRKKPITAGTKKHPVMFREETPRTKLPIHVNLHYEAEELHLYSLAVRVLREIINDSAYISCWNDPAGKRVALHDLALGLEAKQKYERVERPLTSRERAIRARLRKRGVKVRKRKLHLNFG